jgi:CRP-like cAMP-binding protein
MPSRITAAGPGNRLLAALTPGDVRQIEGDLEEVRLAAGHVLFNVGGPVTHVYFPHDSVVSLVTMTEEGDTVETATIGREGVVGFIAALGGREALCRTLVQAPGAAARLPRARLRVAFDESPGFRQLLLCYTEALFAQVQQSVACNALHGVEARCCRWLLMAHDRTEDEVLPLTQQFVAEMLGVQRSTVALVARTLQQAGLIRYRRGRIVVTDRAGLEAASCECYRIVRGHFERLLPRTYA